MRVLTSQLLLRGYHRWLGAVLAIPGLFLFSTGISLQLKDHIPQLQPKTPDFPTNFKPRVFVIDGAKLLETINYSNPKKPILISDISQVDVRPQKNLIRVRTKKYYEYQLSINPLQLLNQGPRYATLILSLHSGEYFGSVTKYLCFLPISFLLLGLWVSGIFLCFLAVRRKAL